jgi:hypothetical protein
MREKVGTIGTSPSYPSTGSPVAVRRITTEGREVSRAGGATTGEMGRAFAICRGSPGGKVCQGGACSGGKSERGAGSAAVGDGEGLGTWGWGLVRRCAQFSTGIVRSTVILETVVCPPTRTGAGEGLHRCAEVAPIWRTVAAESRELIAVSDVFGCQRAGEPG